jgi:hypothetical protein
MHPNRAAALALRRNYTECRKNVLDLVIGRNLDLGLLVFIATGAFDGYASSRVVASRR